VKNRIVTMAGCIAIYGGNNAHYRDRSRLNPHALDREARRAFCQG